MAKLNPQRIQYYLQEIKKIRKINPALGWKTEDYRKFRLIELDEILKSELNKTDIKFRCGNCSEPLYKPHILNKASHGEYLCRECSKKNVEKGKNNKKISYQNLEKLMTEEVLSHQI